MNASVIETEATAARGRRKGGRSPLTGIFPPCDRDSPGFD